MDKSTKNYFMDALMIMAGTFLLAVSIHMFFSPQELVTGGVSGIAIIVESASKRYLPFAIPIWLTNIVLNIPLFLVSARHNGRSFLIKSAFATVFLSFFLYILEFVPVIDTDLVLASVFGGVSMGIGLGMVFSRFATTGGSDMAASIIHNYMKHISVSRIMFIIDSVIIALGLFVFGAERAMYAVIAVFISSKVIDAVQEGLYVSKAAFIISNRPEEISKRIIEDLKRGATKLLGKGVYSGSEKNVILCVVSQKEIVTLKGIISEIDKNAFVIVADVREVLGEGFQNL